MNIKRHIYCFCLAGFWLVVLLLLSGAANRQILFLVTVAGIAITAVYYYLRIYHPLADTREFLQRVIRNKEWSGLFQSKYWEQMYFHKEIEMIMSGIIEEERQKDAAEDYERQAMLQELQSQINPHFLYNTLECIRGQAVLDDNMEIAVMLEALGDFFRYSISRRDNIVTLREELENVKKYMLIQNYRFNNRYRFETEMDEEEENILNCFLPKLILQPIIENSILHGFEKSRFGTILLRVEASEQLLLLTVSDNGAGMDADTLKTLNNNIKGSGMEAYQKGNHGASVALVNVNKRIKLMFGTEYGLNIYSTLGKGTDMEIVLPRVTSKEE